jgi:hypothetical protein
MDDVAARTMAFEPSRLDLPRRGKGRQTKEREAAYQEERAAFCRLVLQLRSTS